MKTKAKKQSAESAAGSKKDLSWYFPSTDHGENDGFADSLLEYFQGDHEKYIAREAIQNAVDARHDYKKPVSVTFTKYSMPTAAFPGNNDFLDKLNRCLKFVKGQPKAEAFFKAAISLLREKELSVLKISDFNTRGLTGTDDDVEGNWYRLVRAAGTSSMKGVGGGSFGIGKGAPIAASSLRTVFYSSINEKNELVCQGKARLVSHHDLNVLGQNDVRQGVGFYGIKGYQAIRNKSFIPDIFERTERGTDIYVMGYKAGLEWKEKLIKSVLSNFWLAILRSDLEITIKDGSDLVITKENLQECIEEYGTAETRFYFETVTKSPQIFEQNLKHLGNVVLFVRKDEAYPGKVMMARKPKMIVQEKSYRTLKEPYAAVFLCENDEGNELLRDLEPPAHDKWDYARAENGKIILREMDAFINQSLKTMAESVTTEPEDIPGLNSYLPDSDEHDYSAQNLGDLFEETGTSTDQESGREIGIDRSSEDAGVDIILRKSTVTNKQLGLVKPKDPDEGGKGTHGRPTGPDEGEEEGVRIKTSSINFRSFVQNKKDGIEYHFAITGKEDCEGAIRIVAVGDDGSYHIELGSVADLKSGKSYETGDSLIKGLKIENGKTVKLAVRLASNRKYALGIETYED